jgi:hypothetical protein
VPGIVHDRTQRGFGNVELALSALTVGKADQHVHPHRTGPRVERHGVEQAEGSALDAFRLAVASELEVEVAEREQRGDPDDRRLRRRPCPAVRDRSALRR